jgi:hypothetical protein
MREFMEGDVVEVIGTAKGSECGQADEVLPWREVGFAMPLANVGANRSQEVIRQRVRAK